MINALEYPLERFEDFLKEQPLESDSLCFAMAFDNNVERLCFLFDVFSAEENEVIVGLTGGFVDE